MRKKSAVLAFRIDPILHRCLRKLSLDYGGLREMLEPELWKLADLIARKEAAPEGEDQSPGGLGVEELTPLDVAGTTLPPLAGQCKR